MNKWYEVKLKYTKNNEEGKSVKVSELYMVDAMSFTEAEAITVEKTKELLNSGIEMVIDSIKKSKVIELFPYDSGEFWFKISIEMVTFSEELGKEMKTTESYLIMADDIEQSLLRINQSIDSCIVPFVIKSISVTNILDVFQLTQDEKRIMVLSVNQRLIEKEIENG